MHRSTLLIFVSLTIWSGSHAQQRTRSELTFPDLPGYQTLRCDFHMHTVFSDGEVWPTVRVEEAWRNGLDVIATTDHLEYLPHKADVGTNLGRSFVLAREAAKTFGILLINAAEITKGEPPGHWNALFLTNIAAVNHTNYVVAVSNAVSQGAFVFWNHPGWQQPDQKSIWYAEQEQVFTNGWLHGIEIVNGNDYDPIAHGWCIEKQLPMLGNSDVHGPIAFDYSSQKGDFRPMTLVFAREKTPESIKEALLARRTAVFSRGRLIGEPEWLVPLFQRSIQVVNSIRIRGKGGALVQIRNSAPLDYELRLNPKLPELDVPSKVVLVGGKVTAIEVGCASDRVRGDQRIALPCRVINMLSAPNRPLSTTLTLNVSYE